MIATKETKMKRVRKPRASTQVILHIKNKKYKPFMDFVNTLDYVQVEKQPMESDLDTALPSFEEFAQNYLKGGLYDEDGDSKLELLYHLEPGYREMQLIEAGKLEGRPIEDLLNEL